MCNIICTSLKVEWAQKATDIVLNVESFQFFNFYFLLGLIYMYSILGN